MVQAIQSMVRWPIWVLISDGTIAKSSMIVWL
jgi:hypothetical protein